MEEYHPGLDGVIATETEVSYLDLEAESIVIRGYDLIELAEGVSYLDVGYLLWHRELPTPQQHRQLATELIGAQSVPEAIVQIFRQLGPAVHLMDALRTGISALAASDPDVARAENVDRDRQLLSLWAKMPTLVAQSYRIKVNLPLLAERVDLDYAANFLWQITGREPTALASEIFDKLLTLYSEHEMPNSTFCARVIASTLADPYAAMTGAVASLKGPLHGGANEEVMHMLEKVGRPEAMAAYLKARLQAKDRIMGFGHRVYMHRPDPRAVMMKTLLARLVEEKGGSDLLAMCQIGEDVMRQEKGLFANLDYYAAPVYHLLGIPTELFTPIFFAARTAGLCAHIREQYANNRLYRPRVRYLGPRGLRMESESGSI